MPEVQEIHGHLQNGTEVEVKWRKWAVGAYRQCLFRFGPALEEPFIMF